MKREKLMIDGRVIWQVGHNTKVVTQNGTFKVFACSIAIQNKGNTTVRLDDDWTLAPNEGISDNLELTAVINHQYRVTFDASGVGSPVNRLEVRWMGVQLDELARYEEQYRD